MVGVGASAGGLDAFRRFLKVIPEDSGMAYVLVQHLDPSHESLLPDLLSRVTRIPVNEITEDIHLAPDHIYVIPSNQTLTSMDGVLKLRPRDGKVKNLPIDVFFASLAEVHQSLAVGVILSGTASDGTQGLKAIKSHGGITFAQDQASAAYGDMPQNAVNAEVVDFVLPPEKIPGKIAQVMQSYNISSGLRKPNELPKDDEAIFKQILLLLRQRSGVDFTYYKQTTVRRRIARRMALSRCKNLGDYLKFLRKDKTEQQSLFQDMLIPVSAFFRDPNIFKSLSETVFPAFLKHIPSGEPIRIWVAGCSTGEEAYSLAISLNEFLGDNVKKVRQVQIFASDISEIAISKARTGIYNKVELEKVPDAILKTYFTRNNGDYQVNRQIRDMIVFAVHNFLKDPPFSKIDLISCRNVLIYMDTFLQKKALSTFHYALKDSGFLFLGKSETTGPAADLFTPFQKTEKIYSRKSVPGNFIYVAAERSNTRFKDDIKLFKVEEQVTDFRKTAETILLSKYTPASVIVNEQMDIVHINGIITPYLEPPQGKPTFSLMKMARDGLAFELRNALHKAKTTHATVIKDGIPIVKNGKQIPVSIEIVPLGKTDNSYFLILFRKTVSVEPKTKAEGKKHYSAKALERISSLEKELAKTREDMRAITEEQEAANEELQSANEELLSGNEEMQSLNEEMETSKEELQSTNEELIIVNQELTEKQEQINASRIYTEAIVATMREPFVVLDKALRIKTINSAFSKKFNITEDESAGQTIYEVQDGRFNNVILRSILEKILPKHTQLHDHEIQINLPPFGDCTLLLNARQVVNEKNREQLILLAIEDITEKKLAQEQIKTFSENLETKVKERTFELEQSNLQLEQFAHTASHEFQEPLRKILTFSSLLQVKQKQNNQEGVKSYLEKIEHSSLRMTKLVKDMLSFAMVKNYKDLVEKTDLNEIFRNTLFDFELLISDKKAKITSNNLPQIEAVPFQMNQLFYDLIYNALIFSKPGTPPVIHVTAHTMIASEIKPFSLLNPKIQYCELVFKDNGIGFDQKYAQQIFKMFQTLSTSTPRSGTGIGLALCKKIVDTYHGEIYAKAKEGKGAEFHVILPLKANAAA